jgi:hypothetical protein
VGDCQPVCKTLFFCPGGQRSAFRVFSPNALVREPKLFWRTEQEAQMKGGRAVKDDRSGGAPDLHKRDFVSAEGWGVSRFDRRRASLTARGFTPNSESMRVPRGDRFRRSRQHQWDAMGESVGPATVAERSLKSRGRAKSRGARIRKDEMVNVFLMIRGLRCGHGTRIGKIVE